MRQVGILAAAGIYALENNRTRLLKDHSNARRLADGLADSGFFSIEPSLVETNIVMFDVTRRVHNQGFAARRATDQVTRMSEVLVIDGSQQHGF